LKVKIFALLMLLVALVTLTLTIKVGEINRIGMYIAGVSLFLMILNLLKRMFAVGMGGRCITKNRG
jgi:hypothetical protein